MTRKGKMRFCKYHEIGKRKSEITKERGDENKGEQK